MAKVFGCFFFRNEGNGCLTSLYQEHSYNEPFAECAIRKRDGHTSDPFHGTYDVTWMEPDTRRAELKITWNGAISYDLTWTMKDGSSGYSGKGFLSEGKLIGSYWK